MLGRVDVLCLGIAEPIHYFFTQDIEENEQTTKFLLVTPSAM